MIAYYYPPVRGGGTARPVKMAKFLSRLGHRVTVCTHADKKKDECFSDDLIRIRDISHNMYRTGFSKWKWLLLRLYSDMLNRLGRYHSIYRWWKKSVLRQADGIIDSLQPELILATYPPVETLEIGLHLSRKYAIPLVSDFRDGLIFEPVESSRINRFSCVQKFYSDLETDTVKGSSAIITASPPITDYFINQNKAEHVTTVLNGYDPDDFEGIPETPDIDRRHFNMVFTGKFSASDGTCRVDHFVEALTAVTAEEPEMIRRFRLHLVGHLTSAEKGLFRKLSDSGVAVLHGERPRDEALSFQKYADMFLLITSTGRSSVITAKVFEYIYFQKPILALSGRTQAAEMISPMTGCVVIHPEDVPEMVRFFRSLFQEIREGKTLRKIQWGRSRFSFGNSVSEMDRMIRRISKKF